MEHSEQEQAYLAAPDAMIEVRSVLMWRTHDVYGAALELCGSTLSQAAICWYRFDVELGASSVPGLGPELHVLGGGPLRCRYGDFAEPAPKAPGADLMACLASAVGAVDGVYIAADVARKLGDYRGVLDVEIVIKPVRTTAPGRPGAGSASGD